jgi:RNA polymerase sigma-70 factor (ECF subfamily)
MRRSLKRDPFGYACLLSNHHLSTIPQAKGLKMKYLLSIAVSFLTVQVCRAVDIDSMPPVVVKTVPEAGSKHVPSGEYEVKVTFSKPMTDESWSWSTAWQNSAPQTLGKPSYEADHRTCVLKVKLEPGKTYGWWINSQKFTNFRDAQGHPAVPYLLTFKTKTAVAPAAEEN